ncbi:MAG: PQQ-binding-like beta-propeller repeat protein, partial [Pseudomonadales bacterium]|nr:PQQ-binding-like beta-propeller repeat protein [Pseudomonadales bacterium]
MINSRQMRLLVWFLALSAMSGCSWFGGDDEPEEIKPNPLPGINEEVRLEVLWNHKIGGGSGDRAIRLRPAILGGRVFAASADGNIKALTTDKGRIIWEAEVKDFYTKEELSFGFSKGLDVITGGVGAGGDLVVVGTGSGEILALNQSDGSLAWKSPVASEVLSQPQIDDDLVVVQSIDGKVAAYDAIDGTRKWVYTTNIPSLTLRGTATPIISDDVILVGFSSGRVVLLDRETGFPGLDHRVGVAQGDSDLERLVDIDGVMAMENGRLYAASYQGRL